MIYEPQHKTAEELLAAIKFTRDHNGARGWIRPHNPPKREGCIVMRANTKNRGDRLHALVVMGKIYLHFDRNESGTHKSGQFGASVHKCIEEFQAADV